MNYTHYDYLELAPGATSRRIEAAYCALLERFQYGHTDAGQDLSGLVRMIHAAYAVLSDPEQRRAYDDALSKEAEAADAELQSQLDAAALTGFTRVQQVPEALRRDASRAGRLIHCYRFAVAGDISNCKQRCGRRPFFYPTCDRLASAREDASASCDSVTSKRSGDAHRTVCRRVSFRLPPSASRQCGDWRHAAHPAGEADTGSQGSRE